MYELLFLFTGLENRRFSRKFAGIFVHCASTAFENIHILSLKLNIVGESVNKPVIFKIIYDIRLSIRS